MMRKVALRGAAAGVAAYGAYSFFAPVQNDVDFTGKSKKKKCPVCGKKGYCYKEEQCLSLGNAADESGGKGGSRLAKGGAGSGRGNRVTRRAKGRKDKKGGKGGTSADGAALTLPEGFYRAADFSEAGAAGRATRAPSRRFAQACPCSWLQEYI